MDARLAELILRGEDRLLERLLAHFEENGFLRFVPGTPEAWRPAVRGISGSIAQAFRASPEPPPLHPDRPGTDDGFTAFLVVEARKHRLAGMPLEVFQGVGKLLRRSYDDLVRAEGFPEEEEGRYRLFLERFFDRTEIAAAVSWVAESGAEREEELLRNQDDLARVHDLVAAAKEEWEAAADCLDDMLLLVDANSRLRRCNRSFREFAGVPYAQLLGSPCSRALRDAGLPADLPVGRPAEHFHEKTGRWFVLNRYPCWDDGTEEGAPSGTVVTIRNATGVRHAVRDLERRYERANASLSGARQSLEEALLREKAAAVGRLAAGIANDISPSIGLISSNLNTLTNYLGRINEILSDQSDCIAAGAPATLTDAVRRKREQLRLPYVLRDLDELIRESVEGAESLRTVAADLKRFSRREPDAFAAADINACVRDAAGGIRKQLERKAALKAEFGKLPRVRCCAPEITWAVRNLLLHAANAQEARGVVTVRTWSEGGFVCVSIADTGEGIPEDRLERVFDPYFSARETGGGEGLALSVASEIIRKHDGEIRTKSEPGKGTTFTVRIPVVEEA
ncbi:MAG: sensor histidine kinase [Verrucomicrobiota bacterium]